MRTTNRIAPTGYVYVDRPLAEVLFDAGVPVTMHGNNINSYHVFGGWQLGCTAALRDTDEVQPFASICAGYMYYNMEPELGKYLVFCVPRVFELTQGDTVTTRTPQEFIQSRREVSKCTL